MSSAEIAVSFDNTAQLLNVIVQKVDAVFLSLNLQEVQVLQAACRLDAAVNFHAAVNQTSLQVKHSLDLGTVFKRQSIGHQDQVHSCNLGHFNRVNTIVACQQ